jgi:hypothetical protein
VEFKDKALRVIEAIAIDNEVESLMLHPPRNKIVLALLEKFGKIYRCAHVARNPSCITFHDKWVKDVNDTYDKLHKAGVF